MSKLFKKVALSVLCAILLACTVTVGTILGLNSRADKLKGLADGNGTGASASSAAAAIKPTLNTNYDYEITIKQGSSDAEKAAAWDEAIRYAGKHTLIKLEDDWTAPSTSGSPDFGITPTDVSQTQGTLYIPAGVTITLDLNGHTLDRGLKDLPSSIDGMVIWVNCGTLNIIDGSGDDSGVITGGHDYSAGGVWNDSGVLNMYGGTITGNKGEPEDTNVAQTAGGGGVVVTNNGGNGGTFNMYGGKITDNQTIKTNSKKKSLGGGVYVYGGSTFNMYGGEISNNSADWAGGFAIEGSDFTMYGGKITRNQTSATTDGGAGGQIYANSTAVINGGEISYNVAQGPGGGLYISNANLVEINGGKITRNRALGTSYVSSTGNTKARTGGGGMYIESSSTVVMNGGEVSYNYGMEGGGVKLCNKSDFTMNGGIIKGNDSMPDGYGSTGICAGYGNNGTYKCYVYLNGGQIVDNNKGDTGYSYADTCEGVTIAKYSKIEIGGPVVIANNGKTDTASNNLPHDLWLEEYGQLTVTGPLYKNGKSAQVGIYSSCGTATNQDIVKGVTSDNLCGYHWSQFFSSQNKGYKFNLVNTALRFVADSTGTSYFKWSYKTENADGTDSNWVNLNDGSLYAKFTYGEKIKAVKAVGTDGTTTATFTWPNGTEGGTNFDKAVLVEEKVNPAPAGATTISYTETDVLNSTALNQTGTYNFFFDIQPVPLTGVAYYNSFSIEIVPKDIAVIINNDNQMYGETITLDNNFNNTVDPTLGAPKGGWQLDSSSTLASWDNYSDLGVQLSKYYGHNAGGYVITNDITATTNKNYNITYTNAQFTITPRPVTIILHDDWAEYSVKVALNQKPVTTNEMAVGDITTDNGKYYDSKGNLVDSATAPANRIYANGSKVYKSGWRYMDTSKTFIAADVDIVNSVYPVVLSSPAVVSSGYTAQGTYDITAKCTNANYTVTFLKPDGTAPTAGNEAKATFTVTGAAISVKDPDTTNQYDKKSYTGSAQNVLIPNGYIILKAGVSTSAQKHVVFTEGDSNIPASTPAADHPTFWQSAGAVTKTSAGKYVVYTLITATNHEPLVHVWNFEIEKTKASFTLSAKHGTDAVTAGGKVTFDNVAVVVDITFTTTGATKTNCPVQIFYVGTNNNYGTAADDTYNDDSKDKDNSALGLGSSTAPKEAGEYTATVILNPMATSDYILDTASTSTFSFTIEAQKISVPTAAFATGSGTYNGSTQTVNYTYNTDAVKVTACDSIVDGSKTYSDLTKGTPVNNANKTTTTPFTATNAGDYAVKFDLTSTRNYKWDDNDNPTGAQIVTCTVKKAQLDFELVSPVTKDGNEVWIWDAGTTADDGITAKANSLTGLITGDVVTFNVSWYKYASGAAGNITALQSDIGYGDLDVDIATFDEQATYFLLIQVAAGAAGNANDNYCLKFDDNHFTPKLEGVKTREITVGAGKVDVSRIIWNWQHENSGVNPAKYVKNADNADDNTKLEYKATKSGEVWTATNILITADLSDLDYLELDTSKGTNGFEIGTVDGKEYGNKFSNAGTHVTRIYVKIKDGSSYEFDTADKSTYTADSKKTAYVDFEWEIAKKVISFVDDGGDSVVEWVYYTSKNNEKPAADATWTKYSDTNKPSYTGKRIYVKVSDDYLKGLGISLDDIEIEYEGDYGVNLPTTANPKNTTTASATLSGESAKNYTLKTTDLPDFEWEIGKTKVTVNGWNKYGQTLSDDDGHEFNLPGVKIVGDDETAKKLAELIEYKYTYTIPGGETKTDVDKDEMIADLFAIADENGQPISIKVTADLSDDAKKNYDIAFDGANSTYNSSIGDNKLKIYISLENATSVYGDVKFALNAYYFINNDTTDSRQTYDNREYLEVEIEAPNGDKNTLKFTELANFGEYIKNAGEYKLTFKITNEDELEIYKLAKSSATFTVTPKPIAVPQITGDIIFNGVNIKLTDHLDANYKLYLDMVNDEGDPLIKWTAYTEERNVGDDYKATLTLTSTNYVWAYPENTQEPMKALARYTVVDETLAVTGDDVNANYTWEIKPFVLDGDNLWNLKGKDGASVNLPEWVTAMIAEEKIDLSLEYGYRTDKAAIPEKTVDFKGGNSFWVEAYLGGADKDNFVFANGKTTSEMVEYTVPQSGAAAFFGSALNFVKNNWLWFVIGGAALLLLILLIIIIAVAKKKKKKKAAEEEAKKEKEEAKAAAAAAAGMPMAAMAGMAMADDGRAARAEAEAAKAKAQMEIERAKMEAEMAKMRAQMEAQQAQQQQPAPQQVQQPVQQPAQQPQNNVDANVIAELKAELAALRASHAAPSPSYSPAPYGGESSALAKIEAELAAMRSEQRVLREAELKASQEVAVEKMKTEFARLRADSRYGYNQPSVLPDLQNAIASGDMPAIPANLVGALILSAMNMANKQPAQPAEQPPQVIEAESQSGAVNTPTMYPPDAVITTTTTVDTTNRTRESASRTENRDSLDSRESRDSRMDDIFDIDGFYDKFEGNK
ncbi:MAG: hypothetical protein K2K60_04930 [Clostridia bacterium]|nr:hypothetical protein [Clostridia bacterium]